MASIKKMQEDTIASINTSKAMIDKVISIMEIVLVSPSLSVTFSTSPIKFLLQILKQLGITKDEIEKWLTHFLVAVIPALEISVKAILLTNLKNLISCSVDPRIPEKYRKRHKEYDNDWNTSQEYGIDINIESIDFMDKLSINPLSSFGSMWYFGLENIEDSYKLARAYDMDAFLWFVIHKGKFPNSALIDNINDIGGTYHGGNVESILPENGSLLSTVDVTYNKANPSTILLGNTFAYNGGGHVISMCIDRKLDNKNNMLKNTIVPVSDDWSSVNWYANTRDANKNEKGICNIQYIDQASSDAPINGLVNNKFRFTILPKPYIHIPILSEGEPPWRFKKMLFNDKGEYDKNGRFTFAHQPIEDIIETDEGKVITFMTNNTVVRMNVKSGEVKVDSPSDLVKDLMECYPGLTLFEFNYDYIMSVKLFDAKVLAHALMESVLNTQLGVELGINLRNQEGTETIKEIIKNIIDTDDSDISDCYYSFDNSKYEALLRKSEEKRARQQRFGNVTHEVGSFESVNDILNEYNSNAELHEQIDVLHRAITQASVTVSEGVDERNKVDVEFNFVLDLVEALTTAIVNGILSPKVLMLLEVNQKIMGGTWEKFTLSDLLKSMSSVIIAIVKEVRDLVIQELLKLVAKELEPIIQMLGSILVREQIENYSDAILEIVRNCPFVWFNFGNQYQGTKLDTVDYADIDVSYTKEGEQPSTNKC